MKLLEMIMQQQNKYFHSLVPHERGINYAVYE